jgi:D-inositol-3-phosphate glycosyltransferase
VLRYLAPELMALKVDFQLTSGSTKVIANGDASKFYGSLCRHKVDYDSGFDAYREGKDPMQIECPIHPSYEDKDGVPDRSFGRVSPKVTRHLEDRWTHHLRTFGFQHADVIHLNHLTPMQASARRAARNVPVVATMHGTEIKFWQLLTGESGEGRLLKYASFWRRNMARYAQLCDRIVAISSQDVATLINHLGVDHDRVRYIPHGVDIIRFHPEKLAAQDDEELWERLLIEDSKATEPGQKPGTLTYRMSDLGHLSPGRHEHAVRILWLGRFLTQKRLNQLLRVFRRIVPILGSQVSLIVWGGFPGEHEKMHPVDLARELGIDDQVYFCGWRGHEDLTIALRAVDVLVVPSVNESFGLMYLEAMASGLPVVATRTGGPPDFVVDSGKAANGWLVAPDDDADLARCLIQLATDSVERRRRGRNALQSTRNFSWGSVAGHYRELFEEVHAEGRHMMANLF